MNEARLSLCIELAERPDFVGEDDELLEGADSELNRYFGLEPTQTNAAWTLACTNPLGISRLKQKRPG